MTEEPITPPIDPDRHRDPSPGSSACRTVTITNLRGLHARAAAKFVKLAARFASEITVRRNDAEVSGSSIMGLMMLAAGPGTKLDILASGQDAGAAVDALAELVMRKFDEE